MKKSFPKLMISFIISTKKGWVLGVTQYCLIFANIAYMSGDFWPMHVGIYVCTANILGSALMIF